VNLLHTNAPVAFVLLGWLILLPPLAFALRAVWGRFLGNDAAEHAWLGGALAIALLWIFQVRVGAGPSFGMLGCGLYVILFGRARGLLGLMLALVLHTALHDGAWLNLGLNGVLFALLPALIVGAIQDRIAAVLPKNLFIFMIGNGMFTTLVANGVTSVALIAAAVGVGASPHVTDLGDYFSAALLLAWGESIVSGMLFTALVIFLPAVVPTYERDLYLPLR
jgi:uncharacterized membrane protein